LIARVASTPEIVVPVQVFTALRRELEKEMGTLPAVRALHQAGYTSGVDAVEALHPGARDGSLMDMGTRGFWERVGQFFRQRGWGALEHDPKHPGVGLLRSPDWAEANADQPEPESSCSFSTGFLAGLLSELAGGRLAVLEVTCRGRGDEECCFAFGSEAVIHDLYDHLLHGADLDGALEAL
jgi:hypothetical protein